VPLLGFPNLVACPRDLQRSEAHTPHPALQIGAHLRNGGLMWPGCVFQLAFELAAEGF
jgi:hypothetical protein